MFIEQGVVTINRTTIQENVTRVNGAGIYNSGGQLEIYDSAIVGNVAGNAAGGVINDNGGTTTIVNTTIAHNQSGEIGGAIMQDSGGPLNIKSSTIVNNIGVIGGGIFGTATISQSLLAYNTEPGGVPSDCRGNLISEGYNLIADTTNCQITGDMTGVITNVNPLIDPVADNGGQTVTAALLPGSPAIDAGDIINCLPTDQRGFARPADGNGDGTAICDIGAYEAIAANCSSIVDIIFFAADNRSDSPVNLTPMYTDLLAELRSATLGDPCKTAVLIADLDGGQDTHIRVVQNGESTLIEGLPDATGVLSTAITEYNMTSETDLGGALKWALDTYNVGQNTIVQYIGHGTFVAPVTNIDIVFPPPQKSLKNLFDAIFPLPTRIVGTPDFTDVHPINAVFAPQALANALKFATNNGQVDIEVVNLVHCLGGSSEQFYSLAPYAQTILASPNYAYFAPKMVGQALKNLQGSMNSSQMADAILSTYEQILLEADDPQTPENDHPYIMVAINSAALANIAPSWDTVSYYLLQEFERNPSDTRTKLLAAYQAAAKYDTTCDNDFALNDPDALTDFARFAEALAEQFGPTSSIGLWANTTSINLTEMVMARYSGNGIPWFARFATPETPYWDFDNHLGVSLFTPFEANPFNNKLYLPWQIRWYTGVESHENPNPLQWTIDTQWDEVIIKYWDGQVVETEACLPSLPASQQTGEMTAVRISSPTMGTVSINTPIQFKVVIGSAEVAFNPAVCFEVWQNATKVFENQVRTGYFAAGSMREIAASQTWTPTLTNPYTLTVEVDCADNIIEPNEDNTITQTDMIWSGTRPTISATMNEQFIEGNSVLLNIQGDTSITKFSIVFYQYPAELPPHTQVIHSTPIYQVTIHNVQLPLQNWNLPIPTNLFHVGPVVMDIWGISSNGPSVNPARIKFNYAPPTALEIGQNHYFLFQLNHNDAVNLNLEAVAGDPNSFFWDPYNYGPATWSATAIGSDVISVPFVPFTGEYLIMIHGQTDSSYIFTATRNGLPGFLTTQTAPNNPNAYIPSSRPVFLDPIPTMIYSTYLPMIQN